jgi:hypothetical protein
VPQVRQSLPGPKKGEAQRSLLLYRLADSARPRSARASSPLRVPGLLWNLMALVASAARRKSRYASVGMTIHPGNDSRRSQTKLSSRLKRSGVEGSAVRLSGCPNSWGFLNTCCG